MGNILLHPILQDKEENGPLAKKRMNFLSYYKNGRADIENQLDNYSSTKNSDISISKPLQKKKGGFRGPSGIYFDLENP
jgi:hypothetical protein